MTLRTLLGLGLWAGMMVWAFLFPGGSHEHTLSYLTGIWEAYTTGLVRDPELFTLFNFMGLWPLILGLLLFTQQPVRGHRGLKVLFWLLSFVGGAYVLFPFLVVQERLSYSQGSPELEKLGLHPWPSLLLLLVATGLAVFGFLLWDGARVLMLWETSAFFRVMTVDFFLFQFWAQVLIQEDQAGRDLTPGRISRLLFSLPLFGILFYLVWRSFRH